MASETPSAGLASKCATSVPDGATDCHFHVFGPEARYPYIPERSFLPVDVLPEDYGKLARSMGIKRAVIVQPSVYGFDNSRQLDAMAEVGMDLRATVAIPLDTPDAEIEKLHRRGARSIRINLLHPGGASASQIERYADRAAEIGWHIQFALYPQDIVELEPRLAKLKSDFVVDHFAFIKATDGPGQPAMQALLRLLKGGYCWAKLSSAYWISSQSAPFNDMVPFVGAMVEAAPDHLLWGSDWPHPNTKVRPVTQDLRASLDVWIPDEAIRRRILVDNPAALFGF